MGSITPSDVRFVHEPVAIVGSSCRFPGGANSPSKLWGLLKEPRDLVQEIPPSRFDTKAFYHQDGQHHGDDPRTFDRDFFNISPKEAEAMDPQQRCLLETVYEGVESAGYSIPQLRGSSTGVFVGAMSFDYQLVAMRGLDSLPQYHATGGSMAILANRLSYFYDWRGASVAVDTACSSSLVALHQAVLALRTGEVDMAVTAGANLILGPEPFIAYSNLNMLSPNGRSSMWDISADGYTRGEGFASIILKTLSQALADGDHIECIIRETGVNSDGRTPGITMPSSEAQAQLIRSTYAKCGLDPTSASGRPQYFEAHGTGTPAGDPIEARAIHNAFFSGDPHQNDGQLLVGSIKTVLGHTEGTAGLAGVLKASLAVQHAQIPGNLHFQELNPKIRSFANQLRIPTALTPWPAVPKGQPRRASVNSFGFGGTNAHAIIESWDGAYEGHASKSRPVGLFVLSANSAHALAAKAAALASYLREHPDTDLGRLARSLFQRADFLFRAAFSATSAAQLADKLEAGTEALKKTPRIAAIPESLPPRILGVFTGQGAQWATMGWELYQASDVFRTTVDRLQRSLDTLPESDRPDWSLIDELSAPKETSRVGIAGISQPLCTALQVALVDVLHAAGVEFAAVVGHSSGEIGAAYAAGYLDARDAIRVAYYRGFHSHLAQGPGGKRGKMIAVGMSLEQASAFCNEFGAALKVAASNSPTSCTLAGDADVVDEAKERLDQNNTFARVLAVDTAYHSHHMQPCAAPYLESLRKCGVSALKGRRNCVWYSSVWGANGRSRSFNDDHDLELLEGQYWVDNLTNTVQLSQALNRAVSEESYPLDLALEVGPHPALKGPSSEVIKSLSGLVVPYRGVLKRGDGAVEAFADGVGIIWTSFPSSRPMITFDGMQRAFPQASPKNPVILKGLPTYPWDHDSLIWRESRASRIFRTESQPRHELLGLPVTLGEHGRREVHWRQVFKVSELPWVSGHAIQGEVLFPATGYLTMAYEAAVRLVDDQQALHLVELHDIEMVRAMDLQEDSPGLEVLFTVRVTSQSDSCITAEVACYSGDVNVAKLDGPVTGLTAHFSGGVRLWLGPAKKNALPTRTKPLLPMSTLDMEQFYSYLSKVGYNYSGSFRASSVDRHLGQAVVTVPAPPESTSMRASMHPTVLDTAIQGLLAGFSYPEDGRLGTVYLPTGIDCVRINMAPAAPGVLMADSFLSSADAKSLTGDVDLFNAKDATIDVQMRGVHWTALNQGGDRWLYAGETWLRDAAYGIEPRLLNKLAPENELLRTLLVRTAHFYLRRLRDQIKPSELLLMGKHRRHMMKWVREHLFPQIEAGKYPDIQAEWSNDTLEDVQQWSASYLASGNNDMLLLHAVGGNLAAIARGTMPPLQVLLKDGMLDRLYLEGVGFADGNLDFEPLVKQLAHRYPRMKVLEVGAGTGGTTRAVLSALGDQYTSYAYTDISAGFFEPAKIKFSQHASQLSFKMLNIEKDPVEQGFEEGSFDMVVASNCLHATRSLQDTLRHCRRLLRPGGYLVLLEITRDHLPIQLIMGTLPGWFLGADEGRTWAPTISLDEWDTLLKATGFSGVDTSSTPSFCSVIMSQATDETVQMLREPLSVASRPAASSLDQVLVVGGSELASRSQELLASAGSVTRSDLEGIEVPNGAAVLCLCDLDSPVFSAMTQARFEAVQTIFRNASVVLWVTSGAASGKHPLANVTVGLGRTLLAERSDLRLQFLDVDVPTSLEPSMLATLLLRLTWINSSNSDDILWTHEPQLALRDDALYIPRVQALDTVNRRSTARKRQVTQLTSLGLPDTAVEITNQHEPLEFLDQHVGNAKAGELRVQVTASSLCALASDVSIIPANPRPSYLWIGHDMASGDRLVGLSRSNSSIVTVAEDRVLYRWCTATNVQEDSDPAQLHSLIARALAKDLLRDAKGPVWVHGAPSDLNEAIAHVANEEGLAVFSTTSDMAGARGQAFIHPYISERELQSLRPRDVETFINLKPSQNKGLSVLLRASLPRSTVVTDVEDLNIALSHGELCKLAKHHFDNDIKNWDHLDQILPISNVSTETAKGLGPAVVIDWRAADKVTTLVRPVDYNGMFAINKTYLLFGMTGDVGISIARWMVDHGARNVVLASRNPIVPAGVIEFMSQKGANLRVMTVDITSREALRAAYAEIKSSMPPVGGLINGAMVLRDRLFVDMSWADFEAVLAPKVAGTQNLDELFGEHDEALDFFIVLSSATSLVGIIGQSAYAAANHFAASFARQRRGRGLPGSVVVIGFLTGLGYIFRRSDKEHLATIEKSLLPRLNRQAETDLHEMLAEAIVCGRPDSDEPAELITGIRTSFQGAWHQDPRLSCYLVQENVQDGTGPEEVNGNIRVEAQLAAVEEPSQCLAIMEKCFTQALGNMLQLDPAQIAADVPAAYHGVDSLVSVRIREWFLKELGVEVPVLKIMSTNHTLSRLCEDALAGWRKLQTGSDTAASSTARQEPEMDWAKEVAGLIDGIPALIPPGADLVQDAPRSSARRVVLTGCTGFLGTHMIRNLVADTDVAELHCLCIRSRHVRVQDAKIREYKGDLVKPLLGLDPEDFIRLSQTADLIIHLGAEVNHLKSYEAVRTANVVSTQVLLAMATPRGVPVHFVSSSSVVMLQKGTNELAEIPPSRISPPTDAESLMKNAIGYAASKWVGEMLLERASPPAVVHRFPNIMGPDAPDEIPLVALDRFCTKMRAVPALNPQQWVGRLDIIDVADVVPEFMTTAYGHDPQELFAVHNYCSNNEYWLSDLAGMYEEKLGGKIEVLPTAEWMQKATALGMPRGVEATFTGHDEIFVSPVLRKGPG
ncbi:MAG: Polyketide synthase 19 [Chaenotheca gracillima]|nr:MAG: Polyketide synthase 19 [Chaenotheca gracillima]